MVDGYSITSSARRRNASEIVSPIAFAVMRFIARLNLWAARRVSLPACFPAEAFEQRLYCAGTGQEYPRCTTLARRQADKYAGLRLTEVGHAKETVGDLIVSRGGCAIDLEVADDTLDAVKLAAKLSVVADCLRAIGFGLYCGFSNHLPKISLMGRTLNSIKSLIILLV
jgi:hypothetical protein